MTMHGQKKPALGPVKSNSVKSWRRQEHLRIGGAIAPLYFPHSHHQFHE
jgi:hypothetical protein